jgi:hypothetical protein
MNIGKNEKTKNWFRKKWKDDQDAIKKANSELKKKIKLEKAKAKDKIKSRSC